MKIILSRKGFDSTSGGHPSPIFPDGSMLSLPIPDKMSSITYGEIRGNKWLSVGEAVSQLAGKPPSHRAHLDPDIVEQSVLRCGGWRPIFGQERAAEGHLQRQGVVDGDVFLFFGLFRPVEKTDRGWRFVPKSKEIHALFGWLQIARRISVASWSAMDSWAYYHPHFHHKGNFKNVIYVATERLTLPCSKHAEIDGAGVFPYLTSRLRLTAPDSDHPSRWLLPKWFNPKGHRSHLSYHGDLSRWSDAKDGVLLNAVSRGQEFVLDTADYPEAVEWLSQLFQM
ncbi:MAG: hypothetical protein FWD64_00390 [Acidobacteriaceae bacterium]|nr:hypothetical protein [Acidobacteriaceae bacterium]